ncbi:ATP-binding protein [Pseudofrankia sp. DC12]|uniref:ATP-binding protein n=1 Tax=Pseudofrankia sp. DC12 TaxID=683315 RepID=UPI000A054D29|nr:ATP-binding protein [Pseudofrankia sp. DC12]
MIAASARLPEVPALVAREHYFLVHAPRQTGKTTTLRALAAGLTASGEYAAVKLSLQSGAAFGDDIGGATRAILAKARREARLTLPADLRPPVWPEGPDGDLFGGALAAWAEFCPRPLVLFLDEIDSLTGATLVAVLSQIREGFEDRPGAFPASIALCGLRDVRDYRTASGGNPERSGGPSPFNIIVESLRLGDFTLDEVRELYGQHTAETGRVFTDEAVAHVFALTGGQPWLVNALAAEIVDRMKIPAAEPVTVEQVDTARERVIQARPSHLDSLVRRLREPEVQRVLLPVLAGSQEPVDLEYSDDRSFVRDLGLITEDGGEGPRIANPIYAEVISRALAEQVVPSPAALPTARDFVLPDGRFDVPGALTSLAAFWRTHGKMLGDGRPYAEALPHAFLFAWLDRAVNGDGDVFREYANGGGRADLYLRWRYTAGDGTRAEQREVFEVKTHRAGQANPLKDAIVQLDDYLNHLGLSSGYIVIFDQRPQTMPDTDEPLTTQASPSGHSIAIARLALPPGRDQTQARS